MPDAVSYGYRMLAAFAGMDIAASSALRERTAGNRPDQCSSDFEQIEFAVASSTAG